MSNQTTGRRRPPYAAATPYGVRTAGNLLQQGRLAGKIEQEMLAARDYMVGYALFSEKSNVLWNINKVGALKHGATRINMSAINLDETTLKESIVRIFGAAHVELENVAVKAARDGSGLGCWEIETKSRTFNTKSLRQACTSLLRRCDERDGIAL